jgi:hypothetical protein
MIRRLCTLLFCFVVCIIDINAQQRPKIDRTKQNVNQTTNSKKEQTQSQTQNIRKDYSSENKRVAFTKKSEPTLSVSATTLNFTTSGGTKYISVYSDRIWTISSCPSWVTTTISGNTLKVDVPSLIYEEQVDAYEVKSGYIEIKSGYNRKRIYIYQTLLNETCPNYSYIKEVSVSTVNSDFLRIFVTFNAFDMQNSNSSIICYFPNSFSSTTNYYTQGTSKQIKPLYRNSFFNALILTIPYDELLPSSKAGLSGSLRMNVALCDYIGRKITEKKFSFNIITPAYLKLNDGNDICFDRKGKCRFNVTENEEHKLYRYKIGSERIEKCQILGGGIESKKGFIRVETNDGAYKITSLPSWCKIKKIQDNGFYLSCKKTNAYREGTIRIRTNNLWKIFRIKQFSQDALLYYKEYNAK